MNWLRKLIAAHKNHQIGTYMDRWYIIPPSWNLPFCVRLHHIRRSDQARLHHNHPYTFKSIVLKGWYDEEQVKRIEYIAGQGLTPILRTVRHKRFRIFTVVQHRYHRIMRVPSEGVWTLIWHPRKPKEYIWGYMENDGTHIPHAEYKRPVGYHLPYKEKQPG